MSCTPHSLVYHTFLDRYYALEGCLHQVDLLLFTFWGLLAQYYDLIRQIFLIHSTQHNVCPLMCYVWLSIIIVLKVV